MAAAAAIELVELVGEVETKVETGDHGTDTGIVGGPELVLTTGGGTGEVPLEIKGDVELLPFKTMSRMRVSMGVLPTRRRKKTCSMT